LPTWSHHFCLLHHNHLYLPPIAHSQRGNYDFKRRRQNRNRCATKIKTSYYPENVLHNEEQGRRDQKVLSYIKMESVLVVGLHLNRKIYQNFHVPFVVLYAWHSYEYYMRNWKLRRKFHCSTFGKSFALCFATASSFICCNHTMLTLLKFIITFMRLWLPSSQDLCCIVPPASVEVFIKHQCLYILEKETV
jgi:hypothetical protein